MEIELNTLVKNYGNFAQKIDEIATEASDTYLKNPSIKTYNYVCTTCVDILGKIMKNAQTLCNKTIDMLDQQSNTLNELTNQVETLMIVIKNSNFK